MDAKKGIVDHAGNRQEIEEFQHFIIDILRIFLAALLLKVVLLSHDHRLVITTQQKHIIRVLNLQRYDEGHYLHRVYSSVHIVT